MYNKITLKTMKLSAITASIFLFSFAFFGCIQSGGTNSEQSVPTETSGINVGTDNVNTIGIQDDDSVYMFDDEDSVVSMYLTVRRGNTTENTNHSWNEVNSYSVFDYETLGVERYAVEAILKIGDKNGPVMGELGYGVSVPNATVQIRGNTTSKASQKSFKIEIKKDKGTWREQRTIDLNKHPYDETRIINKLCYDLMKDIPDLISARTQFVNLFVKDETGDDAANTEYVDYGLFTQVEQFNKTFLTNHGLDTGGQFYKAQMFEFLRYADAIKLKSDPDYNVDEFEKVLEIKGDDDHSKLISMLDDLNNYSLNIEDVFGKYFDEDNYFTWLAFNILTGNVDTINRNFYLYSPQNSDKFYFIAWDNDGAFSRTTELNDIATYGYHIGISNYWGCVLHERVLSNPRYRQLLNDKINELRGLMTKEKISGLINSYKSVVKQYIYSMPDILHVDETEDEYDVILANMVNEIDVNYGLYKDSIERPMPFYIDKPTIADNKVKYTWGIAFDLDGENVTYDVEIARDLGFTDLVAKYEDVTIPIVNTELLGTGQYFIRVKATNESGFEQYAMDYYIAESYKYYGVYAFYVLPDGTIDS